MATAVEKPRFRFVIAALLLLVRTCVGLTWIAPGPLLPLIMQEFGVNRGTVSWTVSLPAIVMAVFALPAGILASRLGIRKAFTIGAFLQAAGLLTPFSTNFFFLLLSRLLFAIGAAITFPSAGGIIAQWFSARERPLINGLNVSSASIGNSAALFASVPLAMLISWRAPLTIYGAIAFLTATAWLFMGKQHQTGGNKKAVIEPVPMAALSIGSILKQKNTLLLAFSMMGTNTLLMAISAWLPTYYHEVFHIPLARASSITAIFTLAGIPACILGGFLPMWTGLRKPFLLIPGLLIAFIGLGCFMVNNPVVIFTSVALFGICIRIFRPTVWTVVMELPDVSPRMVPAVISVAITFGSIGGFLGPLIVGYLTDITGSYIPGLLLCCLFSTSLFFSALFLPETGPAIKKKQTL